jgi:groucho
LFKIDKYKADRKMYPSAGINAAAVAARHPGPPQAGQPFKFTVIENCDRIKEEFNFLQAQYHNLKMECEKLAQEKTEIQRHYVLYYEMSYGYNVEMHKQTEIAKRMNNIIGQIIPYLSQDHQQQVANAVERAKQLSVTEINTLVQQQRSDLPRLLQQMHAQQLTGHAGGAPPMPIGLPHPLAPAAAAIAGPLGLPNTPSQHALSILNKQDIHRPEESKSGSGLSVPEDRHRNSISPTEREKYRPRTPEQHELKKVKKEEKDLGHQSDGEKSDQDLVVDDASEISPISPAQNQIHSNGTASPRENGLLVKKMDHSDRDRVGGPHSPRSGTSSNASTPSNKKLEEKPSTPIAKSVTPTNSNPSNGLGGIVKAVAKPPVLNSGYPHYLAPMNGGGPHDLQAAYGVGVHNNLPPSLNSYPRAPLQVGFDPHPQMRAPLGPTLGGPGGKPFLFF